MHVSIVRSATGPSKLYSAQDQRISVLPVAHLLDQSCTSGQAMMTLTMLAGMACQLLTEACTKEHPAQAATES